MNTGDALQIYIAIIVTIILIVLLWSTVRVRT